MADVELFHPDAKHTIHVPEGMVDAQAHNGWKPKTKTKALTGARKEEK